MNSEQSTLRRLVQVVREQWLLVALAVAATIAAAAFWHQQSTQTYEAEAIIEVTPVAGDDAAFTGISVIRDSSDPTRDVETLARFVTTQPVEERANEILTSAGVEPAPEVTAEPVAQSFLMSVLAEGPDPETAAATANAYATATLDLRTENFEQQVQSAIQRLEAAAAAAAPGDPELAGALAERISQLRAVQGGADPSAQLLTPAVAPEEPTGPPLALILVAAAIVGLAWGVSASVFANALLSRLRSERQLLERFRFPILAHVPRVRTASAGQRPISPSDLSLASFEAYRALRNNIEALRRGDPGARSILVTSGGPGEGKTTTALGLAAALAEGGERVLLIDADLRNPSVSAATGMAALTGTGSVIAGDALLEDAVVPGATELLKDVDLLLVSPTENLGAEVLTVPSVEALLASAGRSWDFIVVDSAPLVSVADSLPLAVAVDDVLVTVRRGRTRLPQLGRLAEVVNRYSVRVRGFVFVESGRKPEREDHRYYEAPRSHPSRRVDDGSSSDEEDSQARQAFLSSMPTRRS